MLLIKNITNIPLTIDGNTIYPKSSVTLDIKYNSLLRSLEKSGSVSIVEENIKKEVDEDIPPIISRKRRKRSEATNKQNNLESESDHCYAKD